MKTVHAKKGEVDHRWYLVDADGLVLGRMASQVATVLRGKNKPAFTRHVDTGDFVVVVNAEKVRLTGRKWDKKMYYNYSGYMGGLRERSAESVRRTKPEEIILRAVKGMLPKGAMGNALLTKLKVYAGPDHPHAAQKPEKLELEGASS